MEAIPWGLLINVILGLINWIIKDKQRRDELTMQMYEFARRFDLDAVDANAKHRDEYRRLKEELAKKVKEAEEAKKEQQNG